MKDIRDGLGGQNHDNFNELKSGSLYRSSENINMRKARIIIFDDDPVILDMLGYYFAVKSN